MADIDIQNKVMELSEKYLGKFKISNGQVVAETCPFCDGGEHHDKWTFAIGLYNGAWQCLRGSCGKKGTLRQLCNQYGEKPVTTYRVPASTSNSVKQYTFPNQEDIHPLTEEICTYFALRRISEETLKDFYVGSDKYGNIVFPIYENGTLVCCKYRKPKKYNKAEDKMGKEWRSPGGKPILFGCDNVVTSEPLFITEGLIDAMSLYEAGVKNVVSVPSGCEDMNWIELQYDWLQQFNQIILFGDNDAPGLAMQSTLSSRLGVTRCMTPPTYPEMIYNGVDYNRLCKDANEILVCYGAEKLKEIADACEPTPMEGMLNLSDVYLPDPTQTIRIKTGIPALDSMLDGFGEGELTTISGRRGEG